MYVLDLLPGGDKEAVRKFMSREDFCAVNIMVGGEEVCDMCTSARQYRPQDVEMHPSLVIISAIRDNLTIHT